MKHLVDIHSERSRRPRLAAKQANMADVAERAGVSMITVSRALRHPALVAAETRSRIEAAMSDLGYVPNLIAGGLAATETRIIAVIVPYITDGVFADALRGLNDRLTAEGYCVLLGNSDGRASGEERIIRALLGHRPAGIVVQGANHTEATRRLLEAASIPVVEMGTLPEKRIDLAVGYSNIDAARTITKRLIKAKRRKIGIVTADPKVNDRHADRLEGYKRALLAAGRNFDPTLVVHAEFNMPEGRRALDKLLDAAPDIDAIFCASDIWAAGMIFECTRRQIAVPNRIAICGFADLPIAAETVPSITTIRVPRYEIGDVAADLILRRIAGDTCEAHIDLGFHLIARESG